VQADASIIGVFDPMRMTPVMTNLISNAVKYGHGSPIEISLRQIDGSAEICVKDQGDGIPLEKQASIFERFERATDNSGISGLGLGLYITRQIVEAHHGLIRVESQPGQGASFTVHVPLRS
jgi:signal transduction histidine kinase